MTTIIELTRKCEVLTIAYGNAAGVAEKDSYAQELSVTRDMLNHAIRKANK